MVNANINWSLRKRAASAFKALFDTSFGSGGVAGYSLRKLSASSASSAVRVRRSADDAEQDIGFTGSGLDEAALLDFVAPNSLPGEVSSLTAGFSLRNLSEGYTGAVVKVRRGSDDLEQDFTATQISDGSLETFVGATNDGFVSVWYNQGNGDDAVQGTASSQPKIVDNGSLVLDNGNTVIDFDGFDDYLSFSDAAYGSFASVFTVATQETGNSYQRFLNIHNGSSNLQLTDNESDLLTKDTRFQSGTDSVIWTSNMSGNNLISAFFDSSGTSLFFNSDEKTSNSGAIIGGGVNNISTIGVRSDILSSTFSTFNVNEILVYSSDKSSERLAIENNINDYYNIYTPSLDGFVTTWYDQSGNGNDAVQASAGSQPKIVDNGVVVTDNGKPSLRFNQSWFKIGSTLGTTQLFADASEEFGVINVFRTNTGNQGALLAKARSATQNNFYTFILNDNLGIRVRGTNVVDTISNVTDKTNILFNDWDGSTFNSKLNDEGVINPDVGSDINDTSDINIGSRSNGEFLLTGWQSEVIIFDQSKFTDWNALFNNLLSYYFDKPSAFASGDWSVVLATSTTSEVEILGYPSDGGLSVSVEYRVNGGATQTANITGDKFAVTASDGDEVELRQTNTLGSSAWSDVKTVSYDVDYQAVLDYGTSQGYTLPSVSQRAQQNQLMLDMKISGAWDKLDTFLVMATDGSSDFALIDWKRLVTMTAVNAPVFTTNQGFTGNGTSAYIDTEYIPSNGTNYTLNNAGFGYYAFDTPKEGSYNLGCRNGASPLNGLTYSLERTTSNGSVFINTNGVDNASINFDNPLLTGFRYFARTGSSNVSVYNTNGLVDSNTNASGSLSNFSFHLFGINDDGNHIVPSDTTISMFFAGSSLTAERTDFNTAINNYMGGL